MTLVNFILDNTPKEVNCPVTEDGARNVYQLLFNFEDAMRYTRSSCLLRFFSYSKHDCSTERLRHIFVTYFKMPLELFLAVHVPVQTFIDFQEECTDSCDDIALDDYLEARQRIQYLRRYVERHFSRTVLMSLM
jgi:hypothetical protein